MTSKSIMDLKAGAVLLLLGIAILRVASHQGDKCLTPHKKIGNCVNIKQCVPLIAVFQSEILRQSDLQFVKDSNCGYEGWTPKVCCPAGGLFMKNRSTKLSPPGDNFEQHGGDKFEHQETNIVQSELLPSSCGGYAGIKLDTKPFALPGEYPSNALLEYSKPNGMARGCGGALISKRYVLTAAHCLRGRNVPQSWSLVSVLLGEYTTAPEHDCVRDNWLCKKDHSLSVSIEEQIVHEDYDPYSADQRYDIALLRLCEDVAFNLFIAPICLPKTSYVPSMLKVAGWGITENRKESTIKRVLELSLAAESQCSLVYQQNGINLGEGQFCVGGQEDNDDSCVVDSGGAIIDGWTDLIGIQSFGPSKCGIMDEPTVYTKVYDYVPWILGNMRE